MDLSTVGYIVWGAACLISFLTLLFICRRLRHCGVVAASFLWYLWWQVVYSALWLRINSKEEVSSWLELLFWQVILVAGCGYGSFGIAVAAALFVKEERMFSIIRRWLSLGLITFVAVSLLLVALHIAEKASLLGIVVFSCYFPAACLALVGVVCVWWRDWPIKQTHEMNERNMKRLSVLAAVVGMIDYLLPAFEVLGWNLWEVTFISRVLDSLVYVPGIIPWIIWMDRQPPLASLSFQDLFNSQFHLTGTSDCKTHPL